MGVEHVDMISELRSRSMHTIVDKILGYLSCAELVRVSSVCREWRQAVCDNSRLNHERVKFLRQARASYRVHKENRRSSTNILINNNYNVSMHLVESSNSTPVAHSTLLVPPKSRRSSLVPFANTTNYNNPPFGELALDASMSSILGGQQQQQLATLDLNRPSGFSRRPSSQQLGVEFLSATASLNTASANFSVCLFYF